MKKFFALLMAVVMVLALSVPAFADDVNYQAGKNVTITVPEGRAYAIYQIFTGDLAASLDDGVTSNEVLSNIKWGANGTGTKGEVVDTDVLNALTADFSSASDTDKLAVISDYVDLTSEAAFSIAKGETTTTVPVGYYLIKDLGEVGNGEEYSINIVQVVGPVKITPKTGETTSEKKVKDVNDSTGAQSDWQDSADYDINDYIPYKLSAKITDKYANYTSYELVFHDKMSAGLTFVQNDTEHPIIVKVDGNIITEGYTITEGTETSNSCTFEVKFANLKNIEAVVAGSTITVEYYAQLNSNAVIGPSGNPNTSHITYSNNPNNTGDGTPSTGNTPKDTVIVFTYEFDANKVKENPSFNATKAEGADNLKTLPLEGAGFTLYKQTGMTEATTDKAAEPIWTEIGEITGKTTFSWKGLDDGIYKLVETTTPAGYNTMEDLVFTVTAEHSTEATEPTLIKLECTEEDFSADADTGLIDGDVLNQKGSTLPETGGIGTTIFYVVGAVLVVGAAIILFAKKKVEE